MTFRLAMWSGPRNISTAMMRSWENRADTSVADEPFYACYLKTTGIQHPMFDEVLRSQSADWQVVADQLVRGDCETPVFYQKHMTHHMLPGVDLAWTKHLAHVFLIRHPAEVVASYAQKRETFSADDIGIIRQWALYQEISECTGQVIPVLNAKRVLQNPREALGELCGNLGLSFSDEMLSWPVHSLIS